MPMENVKVTRETLVEWSESVFETFMIEHNLGDNLVAKSFAKCGFIEERLLEHKEHLLQLSREKPYSHNLESEVFKTVLAEVLEMEFSAPDNNIGNEN